MSYQGQSPKVNRLRFQPRSTDPVNPAEGDMQYADGSVREEGIWVYKNSAWVKVGSDQTGDINYISNGDAEAGNTAGWSLGNVTLTSSFPSGVPTFGSGASANLSFTNSSSAALAGTRSFVLASSAATTAGNFLASDAFTIDAADLAKVLSIDITYKVDSGTINASGTSNNSFGIAIYDVTASQWIMPAGVWAITQSSGAGRAVATFQTPITSTQYRLVLFNANATSGAVSLKLDRISVGPVSIPVGAPVTDWVSFTPVAGTFLKATTTAPTFGNIVVNKARWRRVAGNMELEWNFRQNSAGTAGSGFYLIDVSQLGVSIDTNLVTANTDFVNWPSFGEGVVGTFNYKDGTGSGGTGDGVVCVYNSTQLKFLMQYQSTSGSFTQGAIGATYGPLSIVNAAMSFRISVPIAGWSSQVQMSSDTDTRVVAASAYLTIAASTTAGSPINFDTVLFDTHSAISTGAGTWKFTAPVSGVYNVQSGFSSGQNISWFLYKNGSIYRQLCYQNGTYLAAPSSTLVNCVAGDTLFISPGGTATPNAVGTGTLSQCNWINISRLSGPAVVAASETVAASYWLSANFAASTTVPINFNSKEFDTHNAVSVSPTAWRFTAPVTGVYSIQGVTPLVTGTGNLVVYKNGSALKLMGLFGGAGTVAGIASTTVKLNAGDYIDIRPNVSATFGGGAMGTSASNISITKVGN